MKKTDFQTLTRSKTFMLALDNRTDFIVQAKSLLTAHWAEAKEVRLLGISVSNLKEDHNGEGIQLKLDLQ